MKRKKETVPIFPSLMETILEISNEEYQIKQWVEREDPKNYSCYDNVILYFLEDYEVISNLFNDGEIEMTKKQYQMLKKLYEMVQTYDDSTERSDYDKDIINDPRWHEVRDYAKLVYEELIKE